MALDKRDYIDKRYSEKERYDSRRWDGSKETKSALELCTRARVGRCEIAQINQDDNKIGVARGRELAQTNHDDNEIGVARGPEGGEFGNQRRYQWRCTNEGLRKDDFTGLSNVCERKQPSAGNYGGAREDPVIGHVMTIPSGLTTTTKGNTRVLVRVYHYGTCTVIVHVTTIPSGTVVVQQNGTTKE